MGKIDEGKVKQANKAKKAAWSSKIGRTVDASGRLREKPGAEDRLQRAARKAPEGDKLNALQRAAAREDSSTYHFIDRTVGILFARLFEGRDRIANLQTPAGERKSTETVNKYTLGDRGVRSRNLGRKFSNGGELDGKTRRARLAKAIGLHNTARKESGLPPAKIQDKR